MSDSVRSVHRALMLIRLMNRRDSWTLQQIAQESLLAKPTAYRLLNTLIEEGYVHMPPDKIGTYRLTSRVQELGGGLTPFTIYADLADPIIIEATRHLDWPASFAMPSPPFMRIVSCGMPYMPERSAKPTSVGREHWMFAPRRGRGLSLMLWTGAGCDVRRGSGRPTDRRGRCEARSHDGRAGKPERVYQECRLRTAIGETF